MSWTVEDMAELGTRHSTLEAEGQLEPLLATLVDDPVYEFHPIGLRMQGGPTVKRFYTQFCERFLPLRAGFELIDEWVNEDSVAQEYDVHLRVDGVVETHRVLGVLYRSGELLGGERVFASVRFIQLMTGELFDELEPITSSE
jgi:hypothetical protein